METINLLFQSNISIHIIIALICKVVYGGYPISEPFTGGKTAKYNMIDTNPSCYERGLCPMFPPGGRLSSFPNSEEKVQHIFHNLFRMHPNWTLELPYGKWTFGANKNGGQTYFCTIGCKYCGDTRPDKAPLYWYSDANQAARFKQYDENSCDQEWYEQDGITAHHTCAWVLDEYGGGSHCDLFGGCSFGDRASKFCEEDRCWFETEGICAANSCYFDPHCEPIFAAKYDYQGTGFVEGMNGADTVYSRFTKEIFYPLVSGAHFDERIKIVEEDYHPDGKFFTLMLEYFDHNRTQKPEICYSIYGGGVHEMNVTVSWNGDIINGFSKDAWSVMFQSNHHPPESCEPYAFLCKTTLNNFFRLPEDNSYYFGTEWIDWVWSDYASYGKGYTCKENHYYYNENEKLWIVNGGPTLSRKDIWYYKDTKNYGSCIGCSKIAKLQCYESCILSDFTDCDGCDDIIGQIEPPIDSDDDTTNTGGIVAGVLIGLVCCVFIIAYIYYVKRRKGEDMKCKCPSISFGGIKKQSTNDNNKNVMKPSMGMAKRSFDKYEKVGIKKEKQGDSQPISAIIASFNNNTNNMNNTNKKEYNVIANKEGNTNVSKMVISKPQSLCNECQQTKLTNDGKVDDNDSLWYCTDCWKRFDQ